MKNNKFLFLALVLSVGCSKPKDHPTLFSKLEKKAQTDEKFLQRQLAAAPANQCLKDMFTVDLLKTEVRELEKKYTSGPKVTGTWRHLKLADLPIPQATFLKKFGHLMGDVVNKDAIDYSSCQDVPCLFNKIYGKEEGVAGYVHYIWYLRMGNLLAAVNKVHENAEGPGIYNKKPIPLSAYLYRDKEIYAFWRMSQMLRAPHTMIPNFINIYRVPQGEAFDFVVAERKDGKSGGFETCGQAIYNSAYGGTVLLQDNCLQLSDSWETGNFYDSVLHELTHQLDYYQGRKLRKSYRSNEPDYLDVSKFVLHEYKTEAGKTVREWKSLPGMMLVSDYAGTSPQENFAETLAFFRVKGEVTMNKIPDDQWSFISKNYYDDRTFNRKSVIDRWYNSEASLLSQLSFKAVNECSKSSKPTASTYFLKADFDTLILPSMLNCLGAKASEISLEVRSKIRASDPEGCEVLGEMNIKNLWDPGLKPVLAGYMAKYLKELQNDKAYFAKIQEFIDDVSKRQISNSAFLSCTEVQDEESCYRSEVIRLSLETLAPLNLLEEQALDLAQIYLEAHPLNETTSFFMSYYRSFVSANYGPIEIEAEELFARCLALPLDDELPPVGNYFSVGASYMASSIYNCINAEFPERVKSIVRNLAVDDMKIEHAKEELILSGEVAEELKKSLGVHLGREKLKEAEGVAELLADENGQTRTQVLSDLSWVKDVFNSEAVQKDCFEAALTKIEIPLRYQTKMEAFGAIAEAACKKIQETPQFTSWVQESKKAFGDKSITNLEALVVKEAKIRARVCVVKYPVSTNLSRVRFKAEREACLLNHWPAIETAATKKFASDPMVKKFSVDVLAIKPKLSTNRRQLQLRIIKEAF